jgi:hypothetical protein
MRMGQVKLKLLTGARRNGASGSLESRRADDNASQRSSRNELPARRPTDPPLAFRVVSPSPASETELVLEPRRCGSGNA